MTSIRYNLNNFIHTKDPKYIDKCKDILLTTNSYNQAKEHLEIISEFCPGKGKRFDNPTYTMAIGFFSGLVIQGACSLFNNATLFGLTGFKSMLASGAVVGTGYMAIGSGFLYLEKQKDTYPTLKLLWEIADKQNSIFAAEKFLFGKLSLDAKTENTLSFEENLIQYIKSRKIEYLFHAKNQLLNLKTKEEVKEASVIIANAFNKDLGSIQSYAILKIAESHAFKLSIPELFKKLSPTSQNLSIAEQSASSSAASLSMN